MCCPKDNKMPLEVTEEVERRRSIGIGITMNGRTGHKEQGRLLDLKGAQGLPWWSSG